MRFEVLGTVQVVSEGQAVRPVSELRRRLLAVLLVKATRSVATDTLVDALWGTDAPQRPANSLQVHVHRLRQVLDRPERLRGVPGGYQLDVAPDELDAFIFADLQSTARNAAQDGDLESAVAGFREALALWRGAPYADVDEAHLVAPEAKRLAEARMVAYEELYDAELELGRAREIVPELTELVACHPLRERIVGQLMLALYRSGRQSRAEVTYRAARQRLARELKAEPGRELRELFESICSEDPSLDGPKQQPVTEPGGLATKPGQLPPAPGAFVGREPEGAELDRAATADGLGGLVVLTGMAGVGKTGLAIHYSHQVADRYGDGQLYLDLRGHSPAPALNPLEALGHLLRGRGVERVPESTTPRSGLLSRRTPGPRTDRPRTGGRRAVCGRGRVRPLLPPPRTGCTTLVPVGRPYSRPGLHRGCGCGVECDHIGRGTSRRTCVDRCSPVARACGRPLPIPRPRQGLRAPAGHDGGAGATAGRGAESALHLVLPRQRRRRRTPHLVAPRTTLSTTARGTAGGFRHRGRSARLAESRAREAIEVAVGADRLHEGEALVVLARVQLALGLPEAAIEYGEQALAIQQETGYYLGTARAHHVLGEARADQDHLHTALRMFEDFGSPEATEVRRALGR